uniref:Uncharacterized protein n=1 Tax=viral metagenome TaxID=1070528 RepID=A0A6M3JDR8_9ZZZZ
MKKYISLILALLLVPVVLFAQMLGGTLINKNKKTQNWQAKRPRISWVEIVDKPTTFVPEKVTLDVAYEPKNANIQEHIKLYSNTEGERESVVVLLKTVYNSTIDLADVDGLTFSADANSTYIIEVFLVWSASSTGIGIKVSATATNSPTVQAGHFVSQAINGTPDGSAWNDNDVVITTSSSPFVSNNIGKVEAVLKTAESASVWKLRFAAETKGTISIQAGSTLRYRKVATEVAIQPIIIK